MKTTSNQAFWGALILVLTGTATVILDLGTVVFFIEENRTKRILEELRNKHAAVK